MAAMTGSMVCPQLGAAPRAGRRVRPTAAAGVQLTSTFQGCSVSFMAGEQRLHVAAPKGQGRGPRSVVTCAAKVVAQIKLALQAGKANPAPPVGPALGSKGVNIMAFCKEYNAKTADKAGQIIPVAITVYDDKSFSLELKTPPASFLLKEKAGVKLGSAKGATKGATVGSVTMAQVAEIAKIKMTDLNCKGDMDAAVKIIAGSARNMGITVKE